MSIDWVRSKNELGTTPQSIISIYRPKVMCICDKCSIIKIITIRVKSKIINGQMKWECAKCVGNRIETKSHLSIARKNGSQNKDTPYHRWYTANKNEILEKNRTKRHKTTNICQGCKKELSIESFFTNRTYVHPHCMNCESDHRMVRYHERRKYMQERRKILPKSDKPRSYSATTIEACLKNNFKNIYDRGIDRCTQWNTINEIVIGDYKAIIDECLVNNQDKLTCTYCKDEIFAFCFDHYIPLSRSGRHHKSNLRISCGLCNQKKHDWLPDEFEQFCKDGKIDISRRIIYDDMIYAGSSAVPTEWKFPYWSDHELQQDFNRFMKAPLKNRFNTTSISSNWFCRDIVKHFHRAFWQSTKKGHIPITRAFNDNNTINAAIAKMNGNGKQSYNRLLREISFATNYKYPSIFDPYIAAEVFDMFTNKDALIYDPCAGWGTRWLGAIKTNRKYICSEPNDAIRDGLYAISDYFGLSLELHDHALPSYPSISPDIILTSPPWGDTEEYFEAGSYSTNVIDDIFKMAATILNDNGKLILHISPKSIPIKPDETYTFVTRSTYQPTMTNHIFIWNKSSLQCLK